MFSTSKTLNGTVQKSQLNPVRVYIILSLLIIIGATVFVNFMVKSEEQKALSNLRYKGSQLAGIMALHPMEDYLSERRNIILRTFLDFNRPQGLIYIYIHDHIGKPIVAIDLSSGEEYPSPSEEIRNTSLDTLMPLEQSYKQTASNTVYYEFAKPIFQNGDKAGTIRLGFEHHQTTMLSRKSLTMLTMISLLIFSTAAFGYYSFITALKPLKNFNSFFKDHSHKNTLTKKWNYASDKSHKPDATENE